MNPGHERFQHVVAPRSVLRRYKNLAAILLSCVMATPAIAQIEFDTLELVTGETGRQTILTGYLTEGAVADIAQISIDDDGARRLRIYTLRDGTWEPSVDFTLTHAVTFVDVATIDGQDRIVSGEPGLLRWFDPSSALSHELLVVSSSFVPPRRDEIPHVDVSHDLNGDGCDDIVVPDVDGFWISVQRGQGKFSDPVKIGLETDLSRIYGADGYRYDPWSESRVFSMDYDQDGLADLVYWDGERFAVHLQDVSRQFAGDPRRFATDVPFDSDRPDTLTTGDMSGRVLHSITDMNSDGVGDLVIYTLTGDRLSQKESAYEIHFGEPNPDGGTRFSREVGHRFRSAGRVHLGMRRYDFDHDGRTDVMLTTIPNRFLGNDLWKRIKGAMGDDVVLELEFYRMADGMYPSTPNATNVILLDGPPSLREPGGISLEIALRGATHEKRRTQKIWPRAFNTTLRIGDLDGDGHADFIKSDHPRKMNVHLGTPGPGLFAARPQSFDISLPNDEEYTWLADLNNDGKQDIVMHHPFTLRDIHGAPTQPPGTEPHRITLLISK